jgi:hypothetical protein
MRIAVLTPRFSSSSYMMLRASKIRLYAGFGAPQRDSKPQKEAEGELALALCGDARDLLAWQIERAGRNMSAAIDSCLLMVAALAPGTPAANRRKQSNQ